MAIIYKALNVINSKIYIGATNQELDIRKCQHKSRALNGYGCAFYHAIRKYGWNSFLWEVIEYDIESNEIEEREIYYINKYNSFADTGHGYNRTIGGGGTLGYTFTDAQKENIRKSVKDSLIKKYGIKKQLRLFHNRTGVPHSNETKKSISESLKSLPLGTVPSKLHYTEWENIKSLRGQGLSLRSIGDIYGVRPETVFYFCKRREIRAA